jgi:hypothetical protein
MSSSASASALAAVDPRDAIILQLQQQMQQVQQHMHQQANVYAQQQAAQAAQSQVAASVVPVSSRPVALPRLAPAPRFSGGMGASADSFVRTMEQHFAFYSMGSDATKLQFAAAHLDSAALVWYNAVVPKPTTWAEFLQKLYARFRPLSATMLARSKLGALRQGRNTVTAFTNAFQTILGPIDDMGDADQVHFYMSGLTTEVMRRVMEKHPKTLAEAIELAASTEASLNFAGRGAASSNSGYGNRPNPSESVPMDINAVDEQEDDGVSAPRFHEEPAVNRGTGMEAVLLAKLEAMEHRLATLQQGTASKTSRYEHGKVPGIKVGDIERLRKEGKCFRCKQKGHMKRECPQGVRPLNY